MKTYRWRRCKFEVDKWGVYVTPLLGFDHQSGSLRFWVGWLWFLFTIEPKDT